MASYVEIIAAICMYVYIYTHLHKDQSENIPSYFTLTVLPVPLISYLRVKGL